VYPVEVEERLAALPGVRTALVFGVPDARWGQIVAAAFELGEGASLSSLAPHVASVLAPHKRPRLACVVEELPRTSAGKLVRARAAERYASALVKLGG
jgi:acyl-CoA synthetase (AMP-forming)/AMP-acid ligase II